MRLTLPESPDEQDAETRTYAILRRRSHPDRQRRIVRFALVQLPFLAIFAIALYLITLNVTTPWQSMHEDNGTLNESIAINHIRFGLGVTKGQDLLDTEARNTFGPPHVSEAQHFAYFLKGPIHPQVYGDHPPLLDLTIAGSFLIFGFHFWAERLVPIVYALLGLILFYRIALRWFDRTTACVASAIYATFPMFAYFGRNVSHEAPTLCWMLLLLWAYLRWREDQRRRWCVVMTIAVIIGGAYGWPAYYFATILWGIDWWTQRRPSWRLWMATMLPAILTFALVIAQLNWALGGDFTHLGIMFLLRISGDNAHAVPVSGIAWFSQLTAWNAEGFGGWSQLALPIVAGFIAMRASVESWSPRVRAVVMTTLWGLSHILIFRNGAFVHAYWQFYLLPAYALAFAWAGTAAARHWITQPAWQATALVVAIFVLANLQLATILSLYSTGFHVTLPVTPLFDLWH